MIPRTQEDLVRLDQGPVREEETTKIRTPGIENLPGRTDEEVAAVITQVLKSRPNISKLTYVVGSHFELTYKPAAVNQWEVL